MKAWFLVLILLFGTLTWAQEEEGYVEEPDYVNETLPEEDIAEAQDRNFDRSQTTQTSDERIQVECVCPENEGEEVREEEQAREEVAQPSIFPPGTNVNITPAPTEEKPATVQVKEMDFPPAYVEKLPPGFSNETFKPIGGAE